jgi:hypothetical protein
LSVFEEFFSAASLVRNTRPSNIQRFPSTQALPMPDLKNAFIVFFVCNTQPHPWLHT